MIRICGVSRYFNVLNCFTLFGNLRKIAKDIRAYRIHLTFLNTWVKYRWMGENLWNFLSGPWPQFWPILAKSNSSPKTARLSSENDKNSRHDKDTYVKNGHCNCYQNYSTALQNIEIFFFFRSPWSLFEVVWRDDSRDIFDSRNDRSSGLTKTTRWSAVKLW